MKQTYFLYRVLMKLNVASFQKKKKVLTSHESMSLYPKLVTTYPALQSLPKEYAERSILHTYTSLKQYMKQNQTLDNSHISEQQHSIFFKELVCNTHTKKVILPHIGNIPYRHQQSFPRTLQSGNLLYKNKKWFLTFLIKEPSKTFVPKKNMRLIGLDMGFKDFVICSNGKKIQHPKFYRKFENKLKIEQKKLATKVKDSQNYKKQLEKVQRIHEKIYQSRMNFLHYVSTFFTKNFDVIVIESLNLLSMKENKTLKKSIYDTSWATFVKMLQYKSKIHGTHIVEIDRFFPSSQLCSKCNYKQKMALDKRVFQCPNCKQEIDRDINAAKNIENKGKEMFILEQKKRNSVSPR